MEDVADDGAFGGVVYDDGHPSTGFRTRAGVADGFEDGGEVVGPSSGSGPGVGGGEVADGFDVGDEGEAVDDDGCLWHGWLLLFERKSPPRGCGVSAVAGK